MSALDTTSAPYDQQFKVVLLGNNQKLMDLVPRCCGMSPNNHQQILPLRIPLSQRLPNCPEVKQCCIELSIGSDFSVFSSPQTYLTQTDEDIHNYDAIIILYSGEKQGFREFLENCIPNLRKLLFPNESSSKSQSNYDRPPHQLLYFVSVVSNSVFGGYFEVEKVVEGLRTRDFIHQDLVISQGSLDPTANRFGHNVSYPGDQCTDEFMAALGVELLMKGNMNRFNNHYDVDFEVDEERSRDGKRLNKHPMEQKGSDSGCQII